MNSKRRAYVLSLNADRLFDIACMAECGMMTRRLNTSVEYRHALGQGIREIANELLAMAREDDPSEFE